ncbi:MAG: rod shape-determining protein MreC [Clostridiales bacterium]|nr:rod shape-determining protein MreC [Clostridiales bacterium]
MNGFFKTGAFKLLCVVIAALMAGSILAGVSRGGYSPLTTVTGIVFSPAARLASAVSRGLKSLPISFKSSSALQKEIDSLNDKIDFLNEKLVDYEQVKHQNELYKQFLELKEENPQFKFVPSTIIGKNSSELYSDFILNKGTSSGIKADMPVIYGRYLVGVVGNSSLTQCTVKTLFSSEMNVGAYEVRTREIGYVTSSVEYAEKGLCCMPGLSSSTAVATNGMVCTSGIGGVYPEGLVIGTIADIIDGTADVSSTALISPGVDIASLTDVFVITDF